MTLNLEKCKFAQSKVDYLGYAVSAEGIALTDDQLNAIKEYPLPVNAKDLQSALGLFSYFRKFVKNYSRIAAPLHRLTCKDVPFIMTEDCICAFNKLRNLLMTAPILAIYNPKRVTELHTDASSKGFGLFF